MKHQNIKNYIGELLNTSETNKEEMEVPNAILLLVVYMAGLERKSFPLEKIGIEDALDIEKELPAQFHTLVCQLSIKKSKIEQRTGDYKVADFLNRNMRDLLEDFINYFITN